MWFFNQKKIKQLEQNLRDTHYGWANASNGLEKERARHAETNLKLQIALEQLKIIKEKLYKKVIKKEANKLKKSTKPTKHKKTKKDKNKDLK